MRSSERVPIFQVSRMTSSVEETYCDVIMSQIVEAVKPMRDQLDACLIFPSMPAVMKLNKLGTFSMSQLGQSKSVFSEFIKSARKVAGLGCSEGSCMGHFG